MSTTLEQLGDAMASVVANVRRSLVQVGNGAGGGAGTVWHPDGLIVTNAHVAREGPLAVTLADGRPLRARVLAHDRYLDLAALAVDASGLPAIELGDSRRLRPGEWVFALGHPLGVRGAITGGVVIGLGSDWTRGPLAGREWLIVGLHLRPGHSGGPILDAEGRMVGINTAMDGPDIGLAVPIHLAKAFLRDALKRGEAKRLPD